MNYNPSNYADSLRSSAEGIAVVYDGSAAVGAALVLGDKVRPCRVAGGTRVHRVVIDNTDLAATALAAQIGFTPLDGTAGTPAAVAATATWGLAAATTTYELFPPVEVAKDSYLEIDVTTSAGTGTAGTVQAKAEGEGRGVA